MSAPLLSLFAVVFIAGFSANVLATGTADAITAIDPYVRQVPPGAMATAAYMVIRNSGAKDAILVAAKTSAAKVAELHTHINEDGVMKMRQIPSIKIKAKSKTALQPGGLHMMLIDLDNTLKEGDKVAITLLFDDGSSKIIEAPVRRPAPMPAAAHSKMR